MDAEFCVFSYSLRLQSIFWQNVPFSSNNFIKSVRFIRHVGALDVRSARFGIWSQKYQMQTIFFAGKSTVQ